MSEPSRLSRKTVLLTRPRLQCEPLRTQLEDAGFRVLLQPMIEILPPENFTEIDTVLRQLIDGKGSRFDWLVFASRNGVRFFFERLQFLARNSIDSPLPGTPETMWKPLLDGLRLAVVGHGTGEALRATTGRTPDLLSPNGVFEELRDALLREPVSGRRYLVPRGDRGREILRQPLLDAGAAGVREIAVYRSVDVKSPEPAVLQELQEGRIDMVTATSSAIASALVRMFGSLLHKSRLVSISPLTSKTLADLGFPPNAEGENASLDAFFEALCRLGNRIDAS